MLAIADMVTGWLKYVGEQDTRTNRTRAGDTIRSAIRRGAFEAHQGVTGRWMAKEQAFTPWLEEPTHHRGGRPRKPLPLEEDGAMMEGESLAPSSATLSPETPA